MSIAQRVIQIHTRGRHFYDLTKEIQRFVADAGLDTGLCHVFVHHTSASLIVSENADPQVQRDLETFMGRLVPDGDPAFGHADEGPDDMPAHVRSVLTQTEVTLPVKARRCALGTWQGLFLWEHRHRPHTRRITVTIQGE